jgi:hypothetical protein
MRKKYIAAIAKPLGAISVEVSMRLSSTSLQNRKTTTSLCIPAQ